MPCNTVILNTVEIGKVKDHDLMERALRAEFGTTVQRFPGDWFRFLADGTSVELSDGRLKSRLGDQELQKVTGRVKQAVSREAVAQAARRFGWTVQKGADANHFSIVKG